METETIESAGLKPEPSPTIVEGAKPSTLSGVARLDYYLAWVVVVMPILAFILAVTLWVMGMPPSVLDISILVVMYFLTLTGIEVGFHRLFTHRSFKANRGLKRALAILGSMAFEGPVIWWAGTHRVHHRFSDKEGDPHSPHLHEPGLLNTVGGFFHAHMGWLFKAQSTRSEGWGSYVPDLYRDKDIFRIHIQYFYWLALGFVIPAVIGGIVTWSWKGTLMALLWGGFVRVFLVNHVFFWCINSVTHTMGTRPFNSKDLSTNNIWLAIPTLGQSWHNNHHAFPYSAYMSMHWWQIDIGGMVLKVFEKLGWAWDLKQPTPEQIQEKLKDSKAKVSII